MSLYILIYYNITIYVCVQHFYDLSTLVCCWFTVCIGRIIYKFLNVCLFDNMAVAVSGKVDRSVSGLTTPIAWMLSVTSAIDRPKSVPQLPYNQSNVHFYFQYLNLQQISK